MAKKGSKKPLPELQEGPEAFKRFDRLARLVLAAPKEKTTKDKEIASAEGLSKPDG